MRSPASAQAVLDALSCLYIAYADSLNGRIAQLEDLLEQSVEFLEPEEYVGLTDEDRETEWGRKRGFARLNMTEANRLERQHHMLREVQNALNE